MLQASNETERLRDFFGLPTRRTEEWLRVTAGDGCYITSPPIAKLDEPHFPDAPFRDWPNVLLASGCSSRWMTPGLKSSGERADGPRRSAGPVQARGVAA
jgi:hypothetical protein